MDANETVGRKFRISGRVQGVFYRAWTREVAEGLGLGGTVENRPDGTVEVHAVGERGAMERFERRLWEGPPSALVEGVEVVEGSGDLRGGVFRVLR